MSNNNGEWNALVFLAEKGISDTTATQFHKLPHTLVIQILCRTGQEALRSLGRAWWPEEDLHVLPSAGLPLQLQLIGFRRIEAAVNVPLLQQKCSPLSAAVGGRHPFLIANDIMYANIKLWGGHYDYCPYDRGRHAVLCDAAAEGGFGSRWVSEKQWKTAVAVACFFEKCFVARVLTARQGKEFTRGIACEWNVNPHLPDLLSRLFFCGQRLIAPDSWNEFSVFCPVTPDPLTDALLPKVMALVHGIRVRRTQRGYRLRRVSGGGPRYQEWSERVRKLAALLVPYLEEDSIQENSPFGYPAALPAPGQALGDSMMPATGPDGLPQELAGFPMPGGGGAGSLPGALLPGGTGAGTEIGPARRFDYETLDRYYSQHAEQLAIQGQGELGKPKEPSALEVGYLDSEPAELTALVSGQIEWFKTRMKNGELRIFTRVDPLTILVEDEEPGGPSPPHLVLCVDSSGSMKFNPTASLPAQRGKYDTVLLSCYGILKYVQETGAEADLQVAALNFSGMTRASGWCRLENVETVKRLLLAYQGGGTTLNPVAVRQTFDARPGDCLFVVITDGCLGNVPAAVTELKRVLEAGSDLALLHVGEPNPFTEAVRGIGGQVHVVRAADELVGLCLDVAKSRYRPVSASRDGWGRSRISSQA